MQTRKIRLLLSALLITGMAQAQTGIRIKGKVLDENGSSLAGVTINISSATNNKRYNTSTDDNGNFTVDNLDTVLLYNIIFTAVGYKRDSINNFKVSSGDNNSLLIRMHSAANALNEVVVV